MSTTVPAAATAFAPISDAEALALAETSGPPVMSGLAATPQLNVSPTLLDLLRASRARVGAGAKPITLAVPGYDELLWARYRWVPPETLGATASSIQAIKDPTEQSLALVADALVATNCEILVRDSGKLESLQHEGAPVTFTNGAGLAVALEQSAPRSARECVLAVFGNQYAIVSQAQTVMEWLEDTSKKVDGNYLGE